jgi:hypothetical protein
MLPQSLHIKRRSDHRQAHTTSLVPSRVHLTPSSATAIWLQTRENALLGRQRRRSQERGFPHPKAATAQGGVHSFVQPVISSGNPELAQMERWVDDVKKNNADLQRRAAG